MEERKDLPNFLIKEGFSNENVVKVMKYSDLLNKNQWPEESFIEMIIIMCQLFNSPALDYEASVVEALELASSIAFDYNLDHNEFKKTLDSYKSPDELKKGLRKIMQQRFWNEEVKSIDMLTNEIQQSNAIETSESMRREHGEIVKIFEGKGSVGEIDETKIKQWSSDVKQKRWSPQKFEQIAFVWKAMELASGHKLRDVQILSLSLLYGADGAGKIAQINTGEGKTIIIAMLAALLCLDGNRVDIVTTSPELAVPQSNDMKLFFDLLHLSSANVDEGDKKEAYKCDVLYGSINEFEGDVLRDEYLNKDIRSKRSYDIVIVDEADSMLIDGINNVVRLSSPMPGMSDLIPCLLAVYMELENVENNMTDESGETFYLRKDRKTVQKPFNEPRSKFVKAMVHYELMKRIKNQDKDCEDEIKDEIKIPKHLIKFVLENRLMAWIKSAYLAKHDYVLGRNYVISDDDIKIVDFFNTGIVHRNMKWTDGLHQFLQIKHDVHLTSEDLVTNYLGNQTFFYKYKNIYGMTGTLGDESTKNFLLKAYRVKPIIIPPFKVKQHCELNPIVVQSKPEWYESVIDSCITKLKMGRAVAIIAESINETEMFLEKLTSSPINYPMDKILMYQTEKDSKITQRRIEPGEIIITTNICGRGVNIVLSDDVNENGGLHICLTFLPDNDRVQMQNIGRTSRAGKPGTSQVVVVNEAFTDLITIEGRRDMMNFLKIQSYFSEIEKIKVKSAIFARFCRLLHIIDGSLAIPIEWNISQFRTDGFQNNLLCDTIKERFGIWLKIHENASGNLEEQYNELEHSIRTQLISGDRISGNPFYYVLSGNKYLQVGKYGDAIKQFTKAIEIDSDSATFAYVNRSVANLELKDIDSTLSDLRAASKLMWRMIVENEGYSKAVQVIKKPCLTQKFYRKAEILRITRGSIDELTGSNLNKLESAQSKIKNPSTESDYAAYDINSDGILLQSIGDGNHCRIAFVDLTTQMNNSADKKLYIQDAMEIKQNGFIGPVVIKHLTVLGAIRKHLTNFFVPKKRTSKK